MCGLCGALGAGDHWSSGAPGAAASLPAAERYRQAEAANRILGGYGLRLSVWSDRYVLTGRTGKRLVIEHMGQLWPQAEKLAGQPLDPLDPSLMARMEAR